MKLNFKSLNARKFLFLKIFFSQIFNFQNFKTEMMVIFYTILKQNRIIIIMIFNVSLHLKGNNVFNDPIFLRMCK